MDALTRADRDAAVKLAGKLHRLVEDELGVDLTPEAWAALETRFAEALLAPTCNVFRYARIAKCNSKD